MDSWDDPLGEDEAARDRARRRAERARRRAERGGEMSDGAPSPVALKDRPPPPPGGPRVGPQPAAPRGPGGRGGGSIHLRRLIAVLGLACLAFIGVVVFVIAQRGDGEEPPPPPPAKPLKTFSVTIPEGYDRSQTAAVVKDAGIPGNYMKASEGARGFPLARYGAGGAESLEGFLFPATYELFKKGDTAEDLVGKQLDAFQQNIRSIDMDYARSKNLNTYDVVKIASMIEREVQVAEERKLVSAVIYNRLSEGMTLGIDATIRFEDQNYDEPLLESRLDEPTPYNTHVNPGLPPGPIGNPGLASLEAAAKPANVDYLYYVVKPGTCGEHVFVDTEEEFYAASARYDQAREAAGGMSPTEC